MSQQPAYVYQNATPGLEGPQSSSQQAYPMAEESLNKIRQSKDIASRTLTNGIIDYSLKCVSSGPHKHKFAYVNLTPEGEIIGSDEEKATLCIDFAGLHGQQAHILSRSGIYFLKDLSGNKASTWHRQSVFDGLPIEDKMEVLIGEESFYFEYGGKRGFKV